MIAAAVLAAWAASAGVAPPGAALAQARTGYGEVQAVETQLDAFAPAPDAAGRAKADAAGDPPDQTRALASGLRESPAPAEPGFKTVAGVLAAVESDLESGDAAPNAAQAKVTDAQLAALAEAQARWDGFKARDLAALNAYLRRAGRRTVSIPVGRGAEDRPARPGQDLP